MVKISLINRIVRKLLFTKRQASIKCVRIKYALMGQIYISKRAIIEPKAAFIIDHKNDDLDYVIEIGDKAHIKNYCQICPRSGFIKIGKNTSINAFCVLLGYGGITIGECVRIAAHTSIISFNHNFAEAGSEIHRQGYNAKGVTIEDNVWIGTGVRILDGVTIGEGSVIGAGSVVTKDIPSNSVAVGVPAKVIKQRV
jgi:acetyltransferase-like isoleucine patch superfamily enzyme